MGCTQAKQGNPNKNLPATVSLNLTQTQPNPVQPANQAVVGNQTNQIQNGLVGTSTLQGQSNRSNQPEGMIHNSLQGQQLSGVQQQPSIQQPTMNMTNSVYSNNQMSNSKLQSPQHQNINLNSHPTVHSSGFKPSQYEMHDTTDDEVVNQEKTMNFDIGIKFAMQV